jgi:hypothetical protein
MLDHGTLDSQAAIELPSREMLQAWSFGNINIAIPIQISNNINVQVCGIGIGNTATCSNNQWNFSGISIQF